MSIPTSTSNPGYIYTPTYLPTAPGTLTGCTSYRNYTGPTALIFDTTTFNTTLDVDYTILNVCAMVAMLYQVTVDQLIEWNPSLSNDTSTCALQPGYSYCVLESADSKTTDDDDGTYCLSINATEPTTVSNCNCFTEVAGYMIDDYTCADIEEDVDVTEAELLAWNPWLAGDCDTQLYLNLNENDVRSVCIGTDTNAATISTSSTSAAPTPTDTISDCQ
ncbi:uncharacterized protein N7482_002958 [Penicillium canariense]|uniref:LysM domain-containing protein n=1 Tax=Penicillium canariense TaxID=189055 RepID=A0A9W9LUI2_9EURO|nr:uncharacterized protein N7482_002958 [Penicillium canariense]KAJ5177081.1 hypothetical protein N7482_002958 [Penicillium canariense]